MLLIDLNKEVAYDTEQINQWEECQKDYPNNQFYTKMLAAHYASRSAYQTAIKKIGERLHE